MRNKTNRQLSIFCQWSDHKYTHELKQMDALVDRHPEFNDWVYDDLRVRKDLRNTGVQGMSAEQVLRAGILKQQNSWSYEYLALQTLDSGMTKSFVRLDFGESYSASTLQENIAKIRASTWQNISNALVLDAKELGIENGRTVRMDATVIESNIHNPSDSSLLYDCLRVATRIFKYFRKNAGGSYYPKASAKQAKAMMLAIMNAKNQDERKKHYKKLLRLADALLKQLPFALKRFEGFNEGGYFDRQLNELKNVAELLPLIISQTKRRVIKGETVASEDKVISIFEPHSDVIVKGKRQTEFGHKVFFTSGASGLITDCQLVQGNPNDGEYFIDLLENQVKLYGRAPRQTSADGCFASWDNVEEAKDLGVSDVCFSKTCGLNITDMVKSEWVFQKLRNFRAGIEGIISCLKRAFGLKRVTWRGVKGFASYVHSAVASYNL